MGLPLGVACIYYPSQNNQVQANCCTWQHTRRSLTTCFMLQLIRLIPERCESFALTEDDKQWVADNDGHFITDDIVLNYEDYTMKSVLTAILPDGVDVPKAFEIIGHIIHVNLRNEHESYKKIIGKSLLQFVVT